MTDVARETKSVGVLVSGDYLENSYPDHLTADAHDWEPHDFMDDLDCTHCNGEGTCDDGCDPLWYADIHTCHACNGSGRRRDQVIF